jgi:NodT family efflux transporter outer membrane factor (OMF) lipoprotein
MRPTSAKSQAKATRRRAFSARRPHYLFPALALLLFASACSVGPKYQKPDAIVPTAYKEQPPAANQTGAEWKQGQPKDAIPRGKWWEIYNDPQLNALEEQVSISNQNLLAAEAQFRGARDAVRIARSSLYPVVSGSPSITNTRTSTTLTNNTVGQAVHTTYDLPVSLSYVADIWGSIRHSVRASAENAQVSAALVEGACLSYQAELAQDYFLLHGSDGEKALLENTVKSYQDYLQLTKDRFNSGVASGADVAQAQAQLDGARTELIDLDVARAQYEHAIAILVGKPPAEVTLSRSPINNPPPDIPAGLPSTLLERRPDIAAAERQMAIANEEIGIAKASYYPTVTLGGGLGLESGSIAKWFTWPSRIWSVGPQLTETLFDAGRRRAQNDQAVAAYDATVANYRQTVLTGFQQVEDNLSSLRILADEANAQASAVKSAQDSLDISTYQYKAGTTSYLQVITAQTTALQAQVSAVNILTRRMVASVLLVEALGGGWDATQLPTVQAMGGGK